MTMKGMQHSSKTMTEGHTSQNTVALRFGLKSFILFVTICALLLGGWLELNRWPSIAISEQRIADSRSYSIETSNEYPHSLSISVTGKIDGTANLTTHNDRSIRIGPGKVDVDIQSDWYQPKAEIIYSPIDVKVGNLLIRYRFHS